MLFFSCASNRLSKFFCEYPSFLSHGFSSKVQIRQNMRLREALSRLCVMKTPQKKCQSSLKCKHKTAYPLSTHHLSLCTFHLKKILIYYNLWTSFLLRIKLMLSFPTLIIFNDFSTFFSANHTNLDIQPKPRAFYALWLPYWSCIKKMTKAGLSLANQIRNGTPLIQKWQKLFAWEGQLPSVVRSSVSLTDVRVASFQTRYDAMIMMMQIKRQLSESLDEIETATRLREQISTFYFHPLFDIDGCQCQIPADYFPKGPQSQLYACACARQLIVSRWLFWNFLTFSSSPLLFQTLSTFGSGSRSYQLRAYKPLIIANPNSNYSRPKSRHNLNSRQTSRGLQASSWVSSDAQILD